MKSFFWKGYTENIVLEIFLFSFHREEHICNKCGFNEWVIELIFGKKEPEVRGSTFKFNKYFFSDNYVPGMVLGMEDTKINNRTWPLPLEIPKSSLETDKWTVSYSAEG
jgi:hypothetical protein